MTKSIYSSRYERLRTLLIAARQRKGLTQIEVATRLARPQSFVSKYERGERRLDVIEFLDVSDALGADANVLITAIQLDATHEIPGASGGQESVLDKWEITPHELTKLVEQNPSLRGILLGYIAEQQFEKLWLRDRPGVTTYFKHDDHDRRKKGDRVVTYQGKEFTVEVKSLQTTMIKREGGRWIGKCQVDASDRRTITLPNQTEITTTCLLAGEFDVLAVNLFAFEEKWRFAFAKNKDLPHTTYHGYTPEQRQYLLATLVAVKWPPEPPFYDNLFTVLDDLL